MKREFGLVGVTATVVGYVIGASIFILPGQLAGSVGPAVVIAYGLAAVIAIFPVCQRHKLAAFILSPGLVSLP